MAFCVWSLVCTPFRNTNSLHPHLKVETSLFAWAVSRRGLILCAYVRVSFIAIAETVQLAPSTVRSMHQLMYTHRFELLPLPAAPADIEARILRKPPPAAIPEPASASASASAASSSTRGLLNKRMMAEAAQAAAAYDLKFYASWKQVCELSLN